jgi:hypothetical protein
MSAVRPRTLVLKTTIAGEHKFRCAVGDQRDYRRRFPLRPFVLRSML